jgi:hypothetical protein
MICTMVNEEDVELVEESCDGMDILCMGFDGENRNDTYSHGILGRAPTGCQSDRSQPDALPAVQLVRANGVMLQIPLSQDAEKLRQHRSRFVKILNVPPEGTPPVLTRLRPCWTNFLSILWALFYCPRHADL